MPPISEHTLKFVADNLDSVPELESLLLMSESEGRSWNAEQLAARIYVSIHAAQAILEALQRRGFISSIAGNDAFQFVPMDDATRSRLRELRAAYQNHLVPLTTYLHSKGSGPVKEFARAFDLKKEK